MILFKPENIEPILNGTKTETRRRWKTLRAKIGSLHWAQTKMLLKSSRFARLKITGAWKTQLWQCGDVAAKAEGYENTEAFLSAFARINKQDRQAPNFLEQDLWAVSFEVVEVVNKEAN